MSKKPRFSCINCGTKIWHEGGRCRSCSAFHRWAIKPWWPLTEHVVFNGKRYFLYKGRYQASRHGGGEPLARAIWEHHHGPIPKGMEVHHIDENPRNDDLGNLALMTCGGHIRHHWVHQPLRSYVCTVCGKGYETKGRRPDMKFCSARCAERGRAPRPSRAEYHRQYEHRKKAGSP